MTAIRHVGVNHPRHAIGSGPVPVPDRAALLARVRTALWDRRDEPHVAPLVRLADALARERGLPTGVGAVPYPDPNGGGIHARVLFLLNDPDRRAIGSGMLTLLDSDPATRRQVEAIRISGFERRFALHWNGIPWPVRDRERPGQIEPGAAALRSLLDRLDGLRGVVTLGAYAGKVWDTANEGTTRFEHLAYAHGNHPSRSSNADLLCAYRFAREVSTVD